MLNPETLRAYEAHLTGKYVVAVEESPRLWAGRIRLIFNDGSTLDLGPSNLVRANPNYADAVRPDGPETARGGLIGQEPY